MFFFFFCCHILYLNILFLDICGDLLVVHCEVGQSYPGLDTQKHSEVVSISDFAAPFWAGRVGHDLVSARVGPFFSYQVICNVDDTKQDGGNSTGKTHSIFSFIFY